MRSQLLVRLILDSGLGDEDEQAGRQVTPTASCGPGYMTVLGHGHIPGALAFRAPAAVEVRQVVPHLRGEVFWGHPPGQADGLAHLGEVLGAVRAAREVLLEAAARRTAEPALQVVGDQLDHLLADEITTER